MRLTTAYLLTLDTQDVFDVVAWHLLRQNAQATLPNTARCMYRAPDGKRCAIGWLIPDDVYVSNIEFFGVRDLVELFSEQPHAVEFAKFLSSHMLLLRDLQGMHDARAPHEWPMTLRSIARLHGLRETVIDATFAENAPPAPPAPPPAPARSFASVLRAYLLDGSKVAARKQKPSTAADEVAHVVA
ncbi:hypothetical protein [Paraburkholderia sp. EG304]|uniref:hypothetical protein n=1 Tax=Paraburkholderia sp. EG304 TaxID=3237015 RepID=UPI00397884E9